MLQFREAFTHYTTSLDHSRRGQESRLPRQGKGVGTTIDASTKECSRTRVAAAECYLQYTDRIVGDLRKLLGRRDVEPVENVHCGRDRSRARSCTC